MISQDICTTYFDYLWTYRNQTTYSEGSGSSELQNILAPLWRCIALKCKHGQLGKERIP